MDAARVQKTNPKSKQAVGAECKNDALTATVDEVARQSGTASKQAMERFGTGITIHHHHHSEDGAPCLALAPDEHV